MLSSKCEVSSAVAISAAHCEDDSTSARAWGRCISGCGRPARPLWGRSKTSYSGTRGVACVRCERAQVRWAGRTASRPA